MVSRLDNEQRFDEALKSAERLVSVGRGFERSRPDRYGDALTVLAETYKGLGRYTEAAAAFEKAVDRIEQTFGNDNWMIANRRERLGVLYEAINALNKAEAQYKQAYSSNSSARANRWLARCRASRAP